MVQLMKRNFDDILDECLEHLLVKGETIEQCLKNHPEQAAELKPLLETALTAKKLSVIQPRPEFRARARYQFHSALQAIKPRRSFLSWQPRWVTAMAIVLVLLLAGGGTVTAASGSMPDEPLYPVKIASEQARLTLTTSNQAKAELYASLADKRVTEIIYLAKKGDARRVEMVTQRLNNYLVRIVSLVSAQSEAGEILLAPRAEQSGGAYAPPNRHGKLRKILARFAITHPAALRSVLEEAPEPVKPALHRAITVSTTGYKQALKAVGD